MTKIITKYRAKQLASYWYDGQFSSLYQFASSGVILKDSGYITEIDVTKKALFESFRIQCSMVTGRSIQKPNKREYNRNINELTKLKEFFSYHIQN